MQNSQASISIPQPSGRFGAPLPASLVLPVREPLKWRAILAEADHSHPASANARCSEKGCVFPAAPGDSGQCLHHQRQSAEPVLFSSHQPTHVVLERVRFGVGASEAGTSHSRDRKRLVELREAFLEE